MVRKSSSRGKLCESKAPMDSLSTDGRAVDLKREYSSFVTSEASSTHVEDGENIVSRSNHKKKPHKKSQGPQASGSKRNNQKTKGNFQSAEQTYASKESSNCEEITIDKDFEALKQCHKHSENITNNCRESTPAFKADNDDTGARNEEYMASKNYDCLHPKWHGIKESKLFCLLLLKYISGWIQKLQPSLMAVAEAIVQKKELVGARFYHTWPKIYHCALYIGKLLLLLLIVWLDCFIRGLDSFLRLGTSSFFVIIWCCIFNIIAMEGIFRVLLSVGIACGAGLFLGYMGMLYTLATLGTVALWLHGWFWMTGSMIVMAGFIFTWKHEYLALLITVIYSLYSTIYHVGWIGMIICMNLAFVSSDILITNLRNSGSGGDKNDLNKKSEENMGNGRKRSQSTTTSCEDSDNGASTSGSAGDYLLSPEEEVIRLLNSPDHYAVLGLSRYEKIEVALLKREYRKKAMLVHPDKNKGDLKAEEAFKKLQNAYEVLLDSVKRKIYDDELRRDELITRLRSFRSGTRKYNRHEHYRHGNFDADGGHARMRMKRMGCKKCNGSHLWIETDRAKAQARWCQDCQNYHQAKDGDGWFEQSINMVLFGMLRKVNAPRAYVCVESRVYDATEWVMCQGLQCPSNTHKPSFHVNATAMGKDFSRGFNSTSGIPVNLEENMTEDELFEWFEDAVAKGMFDASKEETDASGARGASQPKHHKKKRKGKKQW